MDPLDFVISLACAAGELLRDRVGRPGTIEEKRAHDLVTDADRASEAAIVAAIRRSFPGAAILGEEGGSYAGESGERFVVDPLDGTTNFAHGYPLFCVSIAYERHGVLEAGAIDAPLMGLRFAAARGRGATVNGAPARVSAIGELQRALVCTGFNPANYARNGPYFAALSDRAQGVRRDGSAALDLAFVAASSFDAFWEWDLNPWDVAAGALIVAEAGGRVSAIDGGPFRTDGRSIAASNGLVHDGLCAALRAVDAPAPGPAALPGRM